MRIDKENGEASPKTVKTSFRKVVAIDSLRIKRLRQNGSYEPNIWVRRRMMDWRNARSDDLERQDEARERLWERNARRQID